MTNPAPQKKRSSLRRKFLVLAVWLTAIYGVVGFLVLPPLVRDKAVEMLSQQLGRDVSIREVRINPFALSTTIRGLVIRDADGEAFVAWDEVYVNFELASLFSKAWIFREVSTTKPYVRVQVNRDFTMNFSDLATKFSAAKTNEPAVAAAPTKPFALRIGKLQILGARAAYTDLTLRTRFHRVVGPLDITLKNFRTDPENKNPYSFAGTTDAGEKFSWSGYFFLDPLRSHGELALENLSLVKYAPLYQDFTKFEVRDGRIGFHAAYDLELSATNRVMRVNDAGFDLASFKVGALGSEENLAEIARFNISGASVDAVARVARVDKIAGYGGKFTLKRDAQANVNVVELAKPRNDGASAPGGVMLLLRSVTNAVAELLASTNQWAGTVGTINLWGGSLSLEDLVNSRPARLELADMELSATNLSNVSGTNLTAAFALRWNTNGSARATVTASFAPVTLDAHLALDQIDLHPLDPYLESKVNVVVLGSKLGMDADVKLRTPANGLPQVNFSGDVRLEDFSTVDGVLGADLLAWKSLHISGINANLEPQEITVKEIVVDNAVARVLVETNGVVNLLAALNQNADVAPETNVPPKVTAAPTNAPAPAALPKISIANVVINHAQAELIDRSVNPRAHVTLDDLSGTIANLSSDDSQHADVNLHAKLFGGGDFALTGTVNPLGKNKDTDLALTLTNLDLTPTSPYAGKFAGYRISKGKLGFNLNYRIAQRQLKASNLIELDQFTFGEKSGSTNATKLPVKLAIAVLKDRDGKIQIDLPIEGSLDKPDFHIGKVVTRAIFNVILKVVTSPFSVLGALFGGGGEEMGYQDFAPGFAELTPVEKAKLDSVVKALDARPALQVGVVGSVDPVTDLDGLKHVKLDENLRQMKWQSLRSGARAEVKPEQIKLGADERNLLLGEFLRRARTANTNSAATNAASLAAAVAARSATNVVTVDTNAPRYATVEILKASQRQLADARKPEEKVSIAPAPQPPKSIETVEQSALKLISVTDADFSALATQRAEAVKAWLLISNRVDAARVFLGNGELKTDGSRAYLQLE